MLYPVLQFRYTEGLPKVHRITSVEDGRHKEQAGYVYKSKLTIRVYIISYFILLFPPTSKKQLRCSCLLTVILSDNRIIDTH